MKAWTRRRDERGMMLSEGRFQIGPWVLGICSSSFFRDSRNNLPRSGWCIFTGHLALYKHMLCLMFCPMYTYVAVDSCIVLSG